MVLSCRICSATITHQSKTGRCRPCAARETALETRDVRRDRLLAHYASHPEARAKRARNIHIANMAARRNPETAAKFRAVLFENRKKLNDPGVREKWLAGRAAAGKKRSETVMAWCPPEYRDEYRHLRYTKKIKAAEARALILAKLSPFEKAMQRIRAGASISIKPTIPDRSYDCTLGGVTMEAL